MCTLMRISPLSRPLQKHVHTYEIFIARIRDCSREGFSSLISPSSYKALCRLRTHQRDGRVSVENRAAPLRNRFLMSLLPRIHTHTEPPFLPLFFPRFPPVNAPFAIVRSLEIAIIYGKAFISCRSNAYLARNKLPFFPTLSDSTVNHFFFTGDPDRSPFRGRNLISREKFS